MAPTNKALASLGATVNDPSTPYGSPRWNVLPVDNLIDGSDATLAWCGTDAQCDVRIDLGARWSISGVSLLAPGGFCSDACDFYTSTDGVAWVFLSHQTTLAVRLGLTITPITTRYWRWLVTVGDRGVADSARIANFTLLGDVPPEQLGGGTPTRIGALRRLRRY